MSDATSSDVKQLIRIVMRPVIRNSKGHTITFTCTCLVSTYCNHSVISDDVIVKKCCFRELINRIHHQSKVNFHCIMGHVCMHNTIYEYSWGCRIIHVTDYACNGKSRFHFSHRQYWDIIETNAYTVYCLLPLLSRVTLVMTPFAAHACACAESLHRRYFRRNPSNRASGRRSRTTRPSRSDVPTQNL